VGFVLRRLTILRQDAAIHLSLWNLSEFLKSEQNRAVRDFPLTRAQLRAPVSAGLHIPQMFVHRDAIIRLWLVVGRASQSRNNSLKQPRVPLQESRISPRNRPLRNVSAMACCFPASGFHSNLKARTTPFTAKCWKMPSPSLTRSSRAWASPHGPSPGPYSDV
jgi:hypothetical protein